MLCHVKFRDSWFYYAQAWYSEDGVAWTEITANSTVSTNYPGESVTDGKDWYFLIPSSFRYIRIGNDTASTRSAWIDLIEIIDADNLAIAPTTVTGEGTIEGDPNNVKVADGAGTRFVHVGGDPVDAIECDFTEVRASIGAWTDNTTPSADRRYGVYSFFYTSSDPAVTPVSWEPNAAETAVYDFIMSTGGSNEFHAAVKAINPSCEIIFRLITTATTALDYYDDVGTTRDDAHTYILDQAAAKTDIDAWCLYEEEYYYQFDGWNVYPSPAWLSPYEAQILTDTGVDLTDSNWASNGASVNLVRDWLEIRGRFYYQGLYNALKAAYPAMPIYQFIVGTTWAWTIPQNLSAEGWVEYPQEELRSNHPQTLTYFGTDYTAIRPQILPIDQTFYYAQLAGMDVNRQLGYVDSPHLTATVSDLVDYNAAAGTRQFMAFYYSGLLPVDPDTVAGYDAWAASNPVNAALWEKSWVDRQYIEGLIAARNAASMQSMASGNYVDVVRF